MLRHLGYVAIALDLDATTNRTCRLRNATPERLRELIAANLADLGRVLAYNVEREIRLYRISSQLIPFGSHPVNGLHWWEEFAAELSALGAYIAANNLRVSMHPGQFTVLNAPDAGVVSRARAELAWHMRLLDALGTGPESKVVIHVGGAYGDKAAALERFAAAADDLPTAWKRRLVVENDETLYSAAEVLDLSGRTGLPVVFDWLHHHVNPGAGESATSLMARCFATWRAGDGPPKIHYSSQAAGARAGAHADYIDADDFAALLRAAPPPTYDCMLEAKAKERALLQLRRALALTA